MEILFAILTTLVLIFIVPILVYGIFSHFGQIKEPEKKISFFLSVLIQKVGTAIGFVLIFAISSEQFTEKWLTYGLIWVLMFSVVEIGQAVLPNYSKKEAIAGIISEIIYFPLAAFVIAKLFT